MFKLRQFCAVAALTAAPMLVAAGVASAAGHEISISPNPVVAGADITFSGDGCIPAPGNPASVFVTISDGSKVPTITPDADGKWSITFKTNSQAKLGGYEINAVCDSYVSSFDYDVATVSVINGDPGPSPTTTTTSPTSTVQPTSNGTTTTTTTKTTGPALANTGAPTSGLTQAGAALTLVGGATLVMARKRRRGNHAL